MLEDAQNKENLLDVRDSLLRSDFASFVKKSFYTVNPGTKYLHNWHIDLMAEHLKACENGKIKRLIVNIPPRYLKSLCVSVAWPAWLLGHDPSRRIIVSSYSQFLSLKHSLDCRVVVNSSWYKRAFPSFAISSDQNEKSKFITSKRGFRMATSVGGSVTGEGGNFLIVDDPHNPTQIFSEVQRKAALDWFDKTFSSRLDDKKEGVFVVVMQRLHEDDLTGHLLAKQNSDWEQLILPAKFDRKTIIEFGDVKKEIKLGEFLHPEREGKEEVERAKIDFGSFAFNAQYQQNPLPANDGMIVPAWIKRYKTLPAEFKSITQSWDTAIKSGGKNDFSVCTTWGETESNYYLVDVRRFRQEYPDLKRSVINLAEKYKPDAILIEDKASGQSLLQDLKRESKLPAIPIIPREDKVTRMSSSSPLIESGKVLLPEQEDWLADYESELFSFPFAHHDDQVDSTSQFLGWTKLKRRVKASLRAI